MIMRNGYEAARPPEERSRLVSTTFVVPYPPGFPVIVPGQTISPIIVEFLLKLDVKYIHGYRSDLGLSVVTEPALVLQSRLDSFSVVCRAGLPGGRA